MERERRGRYRASSKLDLSSRFDRVVIALFLISLLCCGVGSVLLYQADTIENFIVVLPIFTLSFLLPGLAVYLDIGRWRHLLILLGVALVAIIAGLNPIYAAFLIYAVLGGFGVVGLVVALQRRYFYTILSRIEALGLKRRPDLRDRFLSSLFNIREDTDTRNLTMEHSFTRNRMPWRELSELMTLGFLLGILVWLYLGLNPVLLNNFSMMEAMLMLFLISMYVPLFVMPWAIFKTLDVRICGEFRDVRLSREVLSTLRKTILPVLAITIYAIIAVNEMSLEIVLGSMFAATLFNMAVVGSTAMIFYFLFEKGLVESIVGRWKVFRPMPILAELRAKEERRRENLPGTPVRSYEESMEMDFTPYR